MKRYHEILTLVYAHEEIPRNIVNCYLIVLKTFIFLKCLPLNVLIWLFVIIFDNCLRCFLLFMDAYCKLPLMITPYHKYKIMYLIIGLLKLIKILYCFISIIIIT